MTFKQYAHSPPKFSKKAIFVDLLAGPQSEILSLFLHPPFVGRRPSSASHREGFGKRPALRDRQGRDEKAGERRGLWSR